MARATDFSRPARVFRRRLGAVLAAFAAAAALVLGGCAEDASRPAPAADVAEALERVDEPAVEVGDGEPDFTEEEISYALENEGYENYSELDALDRCGEAEACLGPETMPRKGEERGNISSVHPSGWHSVRYGFVDGESLYNRSHLIAWSLAAENANEENLVTGTRHMNAEGMLPYEEEVARYIDDTENHVLYRVTPIFEGTELVCRGVRIEAYSLEDSGRGIMIDVVCPNVQPGVAIDYETGESWTEDEAPADVLANAPGAGSSSAADGASDGQESSQQADDEVRDYVLNTNSRKFHDPDCASVADMSSRNREDVTASRADLIARGYDPCGSCQP